MGKKWWGVRGGGEDGWWGMLSYLPRVYVGVGERMIGGGEKVVGGWVWGRGSGGKVVGSGGWVVGNAGLSP